MSRSPFQDKVSESRTANASEVNRGPQLVAGQLFLQAQQPALIAGLQDIARDAEAADAPYSAQEAAGAPQAAGEPPGEAPRPSPALSAALAGSGGRSRLRTPTLFLLDEFAALGRLEAVERAMGLMAGYGLQLWPILQDLSQLRDLYGTRANTWTPPETCAGLGGCVMIP
jgi:hypothetical protein